MVERSDGEIQSGVKPPHSKKQGSDRRGLKIEATLGGLTRVSIGPSGRATDPCIGEALKPFPMLKKIVFRASNCGTWSKMP
jgi:hypothetical protein